MKNTNHKPPVAARLLRHTELATAIGGLGSIKGPPPPPADPGG